MCNSRHKAWKIRLSSPRRIKRRRESALKLFQKQANEYKESLSSGYYRGTSIKGNEDIIKTKMNNSLSEAVILSNKLFGSQGDASLKSERSEMMHGYVNQD